MIDNIRILTLSRNSESGGRRAALRPISLLTLSLLTLLDSNFPLSPLWASEFHPLKLRLWLSPTL